MLRSMTLAHTRLVDPANLVATGDIAAMFGVVGPTVSCWKTRHADFPAPVHTPSTGPLYLRSAVLEWYSKRVSTP